ncbi:hypothetical protein CHS0354_009572 [Potamilus streckersoni]|uniref:MULE transposase domain-containing protein n=1 Tax=Potamilus streckersoni TaxID=2493646 RepID=A0AAE0SP59_9BIVA|nr:hypothetical protein CHS0354_009572 [Potamilus streckersoni]
MRVFQTILRLLHREPSVNSFVTGFESGIGKALRLVFDNPHISGCTFHWGQAVWRKLQDKGLQTAYNQRNTVFKFCRKVFSFPFLSAEHIPTAFEKLKERSQTPR